MSTLFAKIVSGDIPCYKVDETDNCFAFLDINPLTKGHTLVIPKKEIDYVFDMDSYLYTELFLYAKKIAKAIKKTYQCKKVGMAVIGLDINHAHIHLVPLNNTSDMDFARKKLKFESVEFEEIASAISKNIE